MKFRHRNPGMAPVDDVEEPEMMRNELAEQAKAAV